MEDQTIDQTVEAEVEEVEEVEETPEPTDDIETLKSQLKKYEERGITQRERTRALKAEIEKLKKAVAPVSKPSQTGGLDEAQLDFFELKGYSEDETEVFSKIMAKTGMNHREVLKDEYALAKVKSIRETKALQEATPSGTRRSGSQGDNFEAAYAKFEATGELPKDFELRAKIVNAKVERASTATPPWHRK